MECVYVANLPPDIRIKDIDDFFRPFGKLVYIDVNHRANPVYANVQFDSPRNAFNAVKARHGYNYNGYTLHLRLVENEVRNRRDSTPPPPPPTFNSYDRQNMNGGFNNYSSNRTSKNYSNSSASQWSSNNRSDLQQLRQQNMDISSGNRSNIQLDMPYYSSTRTNMEQQYASRSNMQQQYSNFGRSNSQQQYSSMSRADMSQYNNFGNRLDMAQQNMSPYSSSDVLNMQQQLPNTSRSNIPQLQNINIQRPNNNWDIRNNGMDWNAGNFGNNFNNSYANARESSSYIPNIDPYTKRGFEDRSTIGKSHNRYSRREYSPDMSRTKSLEHEKHSYARGERSREAFPNDPTNMALETIGNTIMSLLSVNPVGGNIEMPGPSSLVAPQPPVNTVSKRQYLKSLGILKIIRERRVKTSKDRISIKYHTQIVKDYEKFNKIGSRNENRTSRTTTTKSTTLRSVAPQKKRSGRTEKQIWDLMVKQKARLLKKARELENKSGNRKRLGGAYKKRTKILMDNGFLELEAKSLAWNTLDTLEELLTLKREYDLLAKKTVFIPAGKANLKNTPKNVVYRNDLQYLEEYSKHGIRGLSIKILFGLNKCLKRIHNYEKSEHLPLTESKFTKLLLKITSKEGFFKNTRTTSSRKKKYGKATADIKSRNSGIKKEDVKAENQEESNVIDEDQYNGDVEKDVDDTENVENSEGTDKSESGADQEANK